MHREMHGGCWAEGAGLDTMAHPERGSAARRPSPAVCHLHPPTTRVGSAHSNAGQPRLARRRRTHHAASFGSHTTSSHVSRQRAARRAPSTSPPAPSWRPPLRQPAGRQRAGWPRRRRGRLPRHPRVRTTVAGTGAASALPRAQRGKASDITTRGVPYTSCLGGQVGKK